jgi:hypothetical protein
LNHEDRLAADAASADAIRELSVCKAVDQIVHTELVRFVGLIERAQAAAGPLPKLRDVGVVKEWKHGSTDGEIFSVIKNGVPPELNMIPFGDQIKDTEIWNVVNYIRSLAKTN